MDGRVSHEAEGGREGGRVAAGGLINRSFPRSFHQIFRSREDPYFIWDRIGWKKLEKDVSKKHGGG